MNIPNWSDAAGWDGIHDTLSEIRAIAGGSMAMWKRMLRRPTTSSETLKEKSKIGKTRTYPRRTEVDMRVAQRPYRLTRLYD
jgi:hypothetical protein